MLYYLLKFWVVWAAKYYFSKTWFSGLDKLPTDQPLILAVNHPTAFLECAYMGAYSNQARNFLLRGDMFSTPLVEKMLRSIKCIPIYRAQDGIANLKKNDISLAYCYDLLGKGENIYILSEGESKHEKRLRPIQKGTARIAFSAYELYQREDIMVVPVGINYMEPNTFRSKVYSEFGTPIPISEYFEDHKKNPRRAIKLLTDRLRKELRQRVIHVAKESDDELADELLHLLENEQFIPTLPLISTKPSPLPRFIALVNQLNELDEHTKQKLKKASSQYFARLNELKIKDIGLVKPQASNWIITLALITGFLPFLTGYLTHYLPVQLSKKFTEKKVKEPKFHASVRVATTGIFYLFYMVLLFIAALIAGNWWWLAFVMLLPFFGHFSVIWRDYATRWQAAKKANALPQETRKELLEERKHLLDFNKVTV